MAQFQLRVAIILSCLLPFLLCACSDSPSLEDDSKKELLRLATTTSTVGSGLCDVLIPAFEEKHPIKVKVIAKGTGAALKLGWQGKADVVLVHSREAEDFFVTEGYGINRMDVMYNEFIILGPIDDPASIMGETDILTVLHKVAATKSLFISRGDDSGTHDRERYLWELAGISPQPSWYKKSGTGMLPTLKMAAEKKAYVLSDMSTYLFNRPDLNLVILSRGDEKLFNPYGVIAVNPAQVDGVNFEGAMAFVNFLTSKEGQLIIRDYAKERFGNPLFIPMALSE